MGKKYNASLNDEASFYDNVITSTEEEKRQNEELKIKSNSLNENIISIKDETNKLLNTIFLPERRKMDALSRFKRNLHKNKKEQ